MNKLLTKFSPGILIAQSFAGYLAYYLLLTENGLHCSIAYLIHYAHSLTLNHHIAVLGGLPIYIAFVIFGAAMLGSLLGRCLDSTILRSFRQKTTKAPFTTQI